ncbi:hypothetical protein SAY87_031859 [Trapa incisa]|uniref:Uncharacterized protein n=1 Tax=Trapa incisa TaxID=236973 RepID=A0AAN7KQE7_9MYRT|nr:hypothetical protein SAY87_031859 [Trapa incisa]
MSSSRTSLFMPWLLLLLVATASEDRVVAQASRPISSLPRWPSQQRYSKILATLGIVCKCCDEGQCASTWEGPCSQLQCLPWKLS